MTAQREHSLQKKNNWMFFLPKAPLCSFNHSAFYSPCTKRGDLICMNKIAHGLLVFPWGTCFTDPPALSFVVMPLSLTKSDAIPDVANMPSAFEYSRTGINYQWRLFIFRWWKYSRREWARDGSPCFLKFRSNPRAKFSPELVPPYRIIPIWNICDVLVRP